MRKIIYILLACFFLLGNIANAEIKEKLNYDEVYNNLPILDIYFDERQDVTEIYDTHGYFISPYCLFRTSLILNYKELTFNPGYYLLTPKNFSNYDFVMFKQKGKIVGFVPIYQKVEIDPKEVYKEPPKPKDKWYKRPFIAIKKGLKKIFGKFLKPPDPYKTKIESKYTDDGKYFLVWFYQKNYLYKMIFKFQKVN